LSGNLFDDIPGAKVLLGMDTRKTSPMLRNAVKEGAMSLGVDVVSVGYCTTPQLHWLVAEDCHDK
jgi:phosphomannomutase